MKIYISGYTKKDSKGIYYLELNNENLTDPVLVKELGNPTYLQIDYNTNILYCNNSSNGVSGISSFKIQDDGNLLDISSSYTNNANACYLYLDKKYSKIHSVIYGDGIFESRKYDDETGKIYGVDYSFKGEGFGPIKDRQDKSHLHIVYPYENYLYICDLGADKILVFDRKNLTLLHEVPVKSGSGPRHIIFNNGFAYVITELSNEIIILSFDNKNGNLCPLKYFPLLPDNFTDNSQASAIRISLDKKYIFTANRGYDHINVFKITDNGSSIENIQNIHSGGHWCRDFNISTCGEYLIAAHEKSYNVSIFKINNGILRMIDNTKKVPEATAVVCI